MSRDWTPYEQLMAEQILEGKTWTDVAEGLTISINEKSRPMYPAEEIAVMKEYNYLGRLYGDNLYHLYKEGFEKSLSAVEKELAEFIENGMKLGNTVVGKWFYGKLDPGFYYSETNNELFADYIRSKQDS